MLDMVSVRLSAQYSSEMPLQIHNTDHQSTYYTICVPFNKTFRLIQSQDTEEQPMIDTTHNNAQIFW